MAKFLTSARSVDMLGRQQIAGIPTAVSEIFKNGYDAYATSVRGDFFPDHRVLVIRDNGVGMTSADFQTRWLTVGTESKASGSGLPPIPRPAGVAERKQMGEKGIGRLAIATTGPQLLIATRAERNLGTPDDEVILALIQWTLFEVPGLTLDDVVIPTRAIDSIDQADAGIIRSMRDEVVSAVNGLADRVPPRYHRRIEEELGYLEFDPRRYLKLNGPNLDRGPGTAFIVTPVSDDVDAVMEIRDVKADEFSVSEFQRFLLGFTNTITPDASSPDFSTEFIRHDGPSPRDIIDPNSYFWSADDFNNTDHTVEGEFDEYGSFSGTLSIYGTDPVEINEPWAAGRGDRAACGPFKIKFGYVQGKASESRLTPEDFVAMTSRLEKIGGLYVYRDGIRVLPYGNADNDYLEIEKRRSLNAATYYFSYRRMFGAIDIDSSRNRQLQEKAGREGFRENRAYRDFKDVLQNFLIQLAAHFFSSKADTAETWRSERKRLERHSTARAQKQQAEKRARVRFTQQIIDATNYVESGRLADEAVACVEHLRASLVAESGAQLVPDFGSAMRQATAELNRLRDKVDVNRPENLPLAREEERDWHAYVAVKPVAEQILASAALEIEQRLDDARQDTQNEKAAHDEEARSRLTALSKVGRSEVQSRQAQVFESAHSVGEQLTKEARTRVAEFDSSVAAVLSDAQRVGFADEIRLASDLKMITSQYIGKLDRLLEQAQSLASSANVFQENTALKEEVLDLEDQREGNLELLQLGQAVQIVSHEFEASIRSVRNGLKDLTPWAKATPRLRPIVRDLRASFAHLDGYLRLFTPLQRRLYREAVVISGEEIESFLRGVFVERLQRHQVEMTATKAFKSWTLEGYPSTFYPTFVNLVDNAIHWVTSVPTGEKVITLDADEIGAYIRDTGPGVRPRDREAIFERGFSRRRGGRGLGLSLARELLERDGWILELLGTASGAVFQISRTKGTAE
ncbi:ATP-binding protein [Citricoccus nitrophenolicus]